jgi:CheY-like chemotaxis protein
MTQTLLCVEDDSDDVFFIERACDQAGLRDAVRFAGNGKAAVDYLEGAGAFQDRKQNPLPHVILLDLNMPLMNGFQFLQWIRSQALFRHIPVIVLTSSESPQNVRDAYAHGANAYVVKPSVPKALGEVFLAVKAFWLAFNRPPV